MVGDWGGIENLFTSAAEEEQLAEEREAEAATATLTGKPITKAMRERAARALFEKDQGRAGMARGKNADAIYNRVEKYYLQTVDFVIEQVFGETEGESGD